MDFISFIRAWWVQQGATPKKLGVLDLFFSHDDFSAIMVKPKKDTFFLHNKIIIKCNMILKFHYVRSWSTGVTTYTCFFKWQNLVTHFVDFSRLSHFQRSNPWIPRPERVRAWHEPSLSSMMWPRKETMHLGFAQPSAWIWFKNPWGFAENWVSAMKSVYPKHVLFRYVSWFLCMTMIRPVDGIGYTGTPYLQTKPSVFPAQDAATWRAPINYWHLCIISPRHANHRFCQNKTCLSLLLQYNCLN